MVVITIFEYGYVFYDDKYQVVMSYDRQGRMVKNHKQVNNNNNKNGSVLALFNVSSMVHGSVSVLAPYNILSLVKKNKQLAQQQRGLVVFI